MAWTVAKVLINGKIDLSDYRGDALMDRATLALARRVSVETDDNPDPNALAPQRVTVRLTSGAEFDWTCETMLAHPARALTKEQHLAKFQRCLDFAATPLAANAGTRLIEMVDRLDGLEDVRALGALAGNLS